MRVKDGSAVNQAVVEVVDVGSRYKRPVGNEIGCGSNSIRSHRSGLKGYGNSS